MSNPIESRIRLAEQRIEDLYLRLRDLLDALNGVRQKAMASGQQLPVNPPSGGGGGYFSCTLSVALNGASSIGPGQSIHTMPGAAAAPTGTIYNDGANPANNIASGKQIIMAQNPDGSYTVIGVYC